VDTTVYFATNRVVTNAVDAVGGYPAQMVPPLDPTAVTYGRAFVTGIDVPTGAQGTVGQVDQISKGGFSAEAIADLSAPGRDLLLFIHGFDNTFSDAMTRAAFNREWLAASGNARADTTIVAFSWPSKGQIVSFPFLAADYRFDQNIATQSGLHLMGFLARLDPIMRAARASKPGLRVTLLAHSMGNLALQSAVETWFLQGNGKDMIFDQAILAAGDCTYDAFDQPNLARLSDHVLQLSMAVNLGAQRLGQDGPRNRADTNAFPQAQFTMVDCSGYQDYDFDFLTSHQYYRQSPSVRAILAQTM
jgi:esterase/lipase superfamily enzyme